MSIAQCLNEEQISQCVCVCVYVCVCVCVCVATLFMHSQWLKECLALIRHWCVGCYHYYLKATIYIMEKSNEMGFRM